MTPPENERGSILLPVILLLLLLATAATAMTLQARTSLREAATRRDRLSLAATADAAVRAAALALAGAAAAQASPPFALDGTPQGCRLTGGRRLGLAVQDEGGLVDLNKATPDLVEMVLRRLGLSAPEAASLAKIVAAHRTDAMGPRSPVANHPTSPQRTLAPRLEAKDFVLADEIGDLPGVDAELFPRLRPLFTTSNRSSGIDPEVEAPGLRALLSPKDLKTPAFEAMTTPSSHSDFTLTAMVAMPGGPVFTRRALFRLDPDAGMLGRFTAWDAPPVAGQPNGGPGAFCQNVAAALGGP